MSRRAGQIPLSHQRFGSSRKFSRIESGPFPGQTSFAAVSHARGLQRSPASRTSSATLVPCFGSVALDSIFARCSGALPILLRRLAGSNHTRSLSLCQSRFEIDAASLTCEVSDDDPGLPNRRDDLISNSMIVFLAIDTERRLAPARSLTRRCRSDGRGRTSRRRLLPNGGPTKLVPPLP